MEAKRRRKEWEEKTRSKLEHFAFHLQANFGPKTPDVCLFFLFFPPSSCDAFCFAAFHSAPLHFFLASFAFAVETFQKSLVAPENSTANMRLVAFCLLFFSLLALLLLALLLLSSSSFFSFVSFGERLLLFFNFLYISSCF